MSQSCEDSSDFTILALTQHDLQLCRAAARFQQFSAFHLNEALCDVDTLAHLPHGFRFDFSCHRDSIDLSDAELWMRQSLCEFTIIGEQNQTLTASVKPANRENTFIWGHEVHDSRTALWVAIGCDNTNWLIDGVIDGLLFLQQDAVDTYFLNGTVNG